MHNMNTENTASFRSKKQGSALITAVIFSFLVVTLMGSYLFLASTEYRLATRSYLYGSSFNLAEGGIELALNAVNEKDNAGWSAGTDASGYTYWSRTIDGHDMGGNKTGLINVVILRALTNAPEIYSEGIVQGHMIGDVGKQLRVLLASGFYPYKNGFDSKQGILLKGNNITMDSYDSRLGSYGGSNKSSEITLATISVDSDAIDIGNADIYGYVATGGGVPDVGPTGSITDYGNIGVVDEGRITTDFYADFPLIPAESLSSPAAVLPTSGTVAGGEFLLTSWSSSSGTIDITGDTVIVVSGDFKMSGTAAINIASGASLKIYVQGDADLTGKGILSADLQPEDLQIFGTNPVEGAQTIKVTGNGALAASVYAPNAYVQLSGGGAASQPDVLGAVAAYDANLKGNIHFSYDISLSEYNIGGAGYEVEEWVELVGTSLTTLKVDMSDFGL